jgi:hypothetical protein
MNPMSLFATAPGRVLTLLRKLDPRTTDEPPTFIMLQDLLRIADLCPRGRTGTQIRAAACDLIEANTRWRRAASRRRLRTCLARVEQRRAAGRSQPGDPAAVLVDQLTVALARTADTPRAQ